MTLYRQGDVLIRRVNALPDDDQLKLRAPEAGRLVLAHGEATGHAHAIAVDPAPWAEEPDITQADVAAVTTLFEARDGRLYLKAQKAVDVVHEEHDTITLEPGVYEVSRQREYSPEEIRRVAD